MDQRKTIRLRKEQPLVRLFHFAYDTYPTDTCKLAWGLIFLPLWTLCYLAYLLFANTFGRALTAFNNWYDERNPKREVNWREIERREQIRLQERREKRSKRARRFEWLTTFMTRATMAIGCWNGWPYVGAAIIIAVALAGLGGLVYLIYLHPIDALIVVGGTLGAIVFVALVVIFFAATEGWWTRHVGQPLGRFFKRLFGTGGQIIVTSYHTVHNHTCAYVDVEGARANSNAEVSNA